MIIAPRLASDAQIVPGSAGLLANVSGDVESIALELEPAQQADLLDLLRQGRELGEISVASGLPPGQVRALIDRLTALGLVAADAADAAPLDPAHYLRAVECVAIPLEPACHVLLAGLGQLGLALLRELLHFAHFRLRLIDPTLVERQDIYPFYCPEDLGHAKGEVVVGWLGTVERARVHATIPQCLPLASMERELEAALGGVDVAVCCLDQPSELSARLAFACHAQGVPLVIAQLSAEGGLIDPVLVPSAPHSDHGCTNCASLYRAGADPWETAARPYLAARFPRPAPWRYRHDVEQTTAIAQLTALALRRALDIRSGRRATDGKVTRIDVDRWRVDTPAVPKHYACRLCYPDVMATPPGSLDTRLRSTAAALDPVMIGERLRPLVGTPYGIFAPGIAMSPRERQAIFDAFRQRGVEPLNNRLANAHRAASVRRVVNGTQTRDQVAEYLDLEGFRTAEAIAMIEGLERLFTLDYCAPERGVHGAYADLGAVALDPLSLPLYAEEQYADPDFPLQRYEPHARLRWIEGVSLADARRCLVPLDFVCSTSEPAIYHATSSGAACHSSLSQAIVNAVYETVERDAFMIAWLNRLALPRIELTPADADPHALRDTFRRLGFELALVDLTTDLDIPVLLGVLRDRHNPDFLLTDMVASLDPQRALAKLCRELAQFTHSYLRDPHCFESGLACEADPAQVRTFRDHLAFYQSREKHRYADFLTQGPRVRRMREASYRPDIPDPAGELQALEACLASRVHDIIVVDCTVPMLAEFGLHVVKVVIPGLQPLNAGHLRRVLGGRRLYRAPVEMGLKTRESTLAELNPWPHPFW